MKKENNIVQDKELMLHIYENADMGEYTITKLIEYLKEKDNKIKDLLTKILEKYSTFKKEAFNFLEENNYEISKIKKANKLMANFEIKKEVNADNSDSSIADMLIKGISMGSIDMEKKINNYQNITSQNTINIAKKFLKFQSEEINELKKYL